MLRGSRPGERRGGRKRFTPNRRTALTDRILAVGGDHPTASRRAFLVKLVKDEKLPADIRIAVAPKCFPAKPPRSYQTQRPRTLARIRTAPVNDAHSEGTSNGLSLQALDSLIGVVQDVTAVPKARRKAALKIAEFLLPKAIKKPKLLPDEYGFKVSPKLASHYRDIQIELSTLKKEPASKIPAVAEKINKLKARSDAILRQLQVPCPTKYSDEHAFEDYLRVIDFMRLRENKIELSEKQASEEAHLRVRLDVFWASPEMIWRERRKVLQRAEAWFKAGQSEGFKAPPLSRKEQDELTLLRRLYAGSRPNVSKPDDSCQEISSPHPFVDELPAADGNYYPRGDKPALGPAPPPISAQPPDNRADIVGDPRGVGIRGPTEEVDFKAWLRGQKEYPFYQLSAAAKRRYAIAEPYKAVIVERLVRGHKLVPEDQVCAYLARYLSKAVP